MQIDYEPEKPFPPERQTVGCVSFAWIALLSAIGTIALLAVLTPYLFAESQWSWGVTLGVGSVVFMIVLLVGSFRSVRRLSYDDIDEGDGAW